jgi:2-C-methyl-D-erythritol 4-phosphate cytidylyltransferase
MNIALLTAAGSATRMNQDIPKQFLHIQNKPILIYTMEAFQIHPSIDAIIVVGLERWLDIIWAYARQYNIVKLKWVVSGGQTGQDSIQNGLNELKTHCNESDIVLVHDGNRPLVTQEIISDSLAKQNEYGSAVAVIPCVEVVFKNEDGISSIENIPRDQLLRSQTPHTYPLGRLLWAHQEAEKRHITNTVASCDLMSLLGERIFFSKGSERNIKITTTEDIEIFTALLNSKKEQGVK